MVKVSVCSGMSCSMYGANDTLTTLQKELKRTGIAGQVEERLKTIHKPITVAVMGCVVNGPGEAREADIGIAGGKGEGLLFRHGEILRKVPEENLLDELMKEIDRL